MTNRTEQPSRGRASRVLPFAVFALIAMCLPGAASAQWTTPDAAGNISTTNTGNVGIGTPTPSAPLHAFRDFGRGNSGTVAVVGGKPFWSVNDYERLRVGFTQFDSIYDVGGGWAMGFRTGASDGSGVERLRITSGGNVGIGTAAPGAKLVVTGGPDTNLQIGDRGLSGSVGLQMLGSGYKHVGLRFDGDNLVVENASNTVIPSTWYNGQPLNFIVRNGKVGVGTTTPATALHVAGDVTVTGNINAKYQDVAEWVPTTQKLTAGTVVVLDPERPNHVLASKSSYDTAVAGVISEKPGLSLGEAGDDKALVATTGRVKVKVDATRGAIKIGDLIVTSDVEGVAMKSEPVIVGGRRIHAPGTIIGKALEPLAGGKGEILVLLSLQ